MDAIRAASVTPLSGPLAIYGRAAGEALRLWTAEFTEALRVDLRLFDSHPDPVEAVRRAEASGADVLFGPYGRGPTLAVARAASRLVWNGGGASDRLALPRFPNVVNIPAPAASYLVGGLEAIRQACPGARSLVMLHTGRGFSGEVARGAVSAATDLGLSCAGIRFEPGEAVEALSRAPAGDILAMAGTFEDELEMVRCVERRRWKAVLSVAAGVDEVLAPVAERREGLIGPAQWTPSSAPSPLVGPAAGRFVEAYRRWTGQAPPYPAAQALAAALIWSECFRNAGGAEDRALLAEARRLATRTLFGEFRLDPLTGVQVGHRVITVQWQEGRRRVVWPPDRSEADLRVPRRP